MPWFKVDDNLAFHAKTVAAGNAAMGLWVRAGSWCAQQLTDGHVPDHIVTVLGTAPQARKLVAAGLWTRAEGGFQFHEWNERQPNREQIETERAAARERMRAIRARKKGVSDPKPQVSGPRSPELLTTGSDLFANPDPTRPDPIQNPTGSVGAADADEPTSKKRATRLPASWHPTPEHQERANALGLNLDREVAKFRAHAEDKGRTSKSWNAAFTQWLIRAAEYAQARSAVSSTTTHRDGRGNHQWMY